MASRVKLGQTVTANGMANTRRGNQGIYIEALPRRTWGLCLEILVVELVTLYLELNSIPATFTFGVILCKPTELCGFLGLLPDRVREAINTL